MKIFYIPILSSMRWIECKFSISLSCYKALEKNNQQLRDICYWWSLIEEKILNKSCNLFFLWKSCVKETEAMARWNNSKMMLKLKIIDNSLGRDITKKKASLFFRVYCKCQEFRLCHLTNSIHDDIFAGVAVSWFSIELAPLWCYDHTTILTLQRRLGCGFTH